MACTATFELDRVAAIDILGSMTPTLVAGDTVTLQARAVTAGGAIVEGTAIHWRRIDADTGAPVVSLDTLTGHVTALAPGTASVVAAVETLLSGSIRITVTAPPAPVPRRGPP